MNMTYPLKNKEDVEEVKDYLKNVKKCHKSFLMFIIGISSALRISDILNLRVSDMWLNGKAKDQIVVKEKKTKKVKRFAVSPNLRKALEHYMREEKRIGRQIKPDNFLIYSREGGNKPITRQRAVQILDEALEACGISVNFGSHGMRKTFSYFAYSSGISLSLLMSLLSHSSEKQTLRYIGIEQSELDQVYINLNL